jgi:hypothetical protein
MDVDKRHVLTCAFAESQLLIILYTYYDGDENGNDMMRREIRENPWSSKALYSWMIRTKDRGCGEGKRVRDGEVCPVDGEDG